MSVNSRGNPWSQSCVCNVACAELGSVKYGVMVQTGNEFRCGTNANVFITLYGTAGDSGQRPLTQAKRNAFERNQKANFELDAVDLGTTRAGGGWFISRVLHAVARAYFNVPTGTDVLGDLNSVLEGLVTRT